MSKDRFDMELEKIRQTDLTTMAGLFEGVMLDQCRTPKGTITVNSDGTIDLDIKERIGFRLSCEDAKLLGNGLLQACKIVEERNHG